MEINYEKETIGDIIIQARKGMGISQRDLARRIQVDAVFLCNIEKNNIIPNLEIGSKIASVLGFDLKSFIFLILRTKYPQFSHIFFCQPPTIKVS